MFVGMVVLRDSAVILRVAGYAEFECVRECVCAFARVRILCICVSA